MTVSILYRRTFPLILLSFLISGFLIFPISLGESAITKGRRGGVVSKYTRSGRGGLLSKKFNQRVNRGHRTYKRRQAIQKGRQRSQARKASARARKNFKKIAKNSLKPRFAKKANKGRAKAGFNKVNSHPRKKLYKSALSKHKPNKSKLTHAGKQASKHWKDFGFKSQKDYQNKYPKEQNQNKFASTRLKHILRKGVKTTGVTKRYPKGYITYTLRSGLGASWRHDGSFIGFRGKHNLTRTFNKKRK